MSSLKNIQSFYELTFAEIVLYSHLYQENAIQQIPDYCL